jgi:hypothetical protein
MDIEELLGLPVDELFVRFEHFSIGITSQEGENRLKIYGYNQLAKKKKRTAHAHN